MDMKYSFFVLITYILSGSNCHRFKRLINGFPAKLGEFPYMVYILSHGSYQCGGSLISERHVLSVAHCIYDKISHGEISNLEVVVGSICIRPITGTKIKVARASCHPDFKITISRYTTTFVHDIAVIRLSEPITVSETVKPISLPVRMQEYPVGTQLIANGLGEDNYLKKLTTFAVSEQTCQSNWSHRTIIPGHLCTLSTPSSGPCFGDGGGPLTFGRQILVGLISEGSDSGCGINVPDIFTKVSHYIDFITREMKLDD